MSDLPEIQLNEDVIVEPESIKTTWRFHKLGEVVKALAAARLEFDPVKKNAENLFYKDAKTGKARKYADLSEIIGATGDQLAKHGLVVMQFPLINSDQTVGMTTVLAHEGGGFVESTMTGCPASQKTERGVKFDPQTLGIGFTYLARYGERGILNLGTDDDDGNGLINKPEEPKKFVPRTTLTAMRASPESELPPSAEPRTAQGMPPDRPLEITDDDLPAELLLPTPLEKTQIAAKLKSFRQDSRTLKGWIESKAGKPYNEITKKGFDSLISELENAAKQGDLAMFIKPKEQ